MHRGGVTKVGVVWLELVRIVRSSIYHYYFFLDPSSQ